MTRLDFTAAEVQQQMDMYGLMPTSVLVAWAGATFRHADRLRIRAVRIIGTCAICGLRAPVSMCRECDLDACADHIVTQGGVMLCSACSVKGAAA